MNLGAIERKPDERDFLLGGFQAPIPLPASFLPDISWLTRNYQGATPYCGAHAFSHFQAILEHYAAGTTPHYTPRFSWIEIKTIDGYPLSDGTDMRSIFKAAQANGAADFEPLENDVTLPIETYSDPRAITPAIASNAAPNVVNSYAFGTTDFASICQAVYQNKAVLILIKCDDGFWGTQTPTFTQPLYGHFIVAYGYDQNYLYIVDSADPNDAMAFKKIAKEYVTPTFFFEAGTAVDIPPVEIQKLIQTASNVAQEVVTAPISTTQKFDLLTALSQAFHSLLAFFSPKVGSASPQQMNYSLLRSKTFWTLVFIFIFNGYTAISGQVPADWSVVINIVLTGLASVFHLTTGQSTTGTN